MIVAVDPIGCGMARHVEREEIVRCRDCLYWREEDFCVNPQWQSIRSSSGLVECPCTFPESFCSFAERRDA